jgi:hypothetical protein
MNDDSQSRPDTTSRVTREPWFVPLAHSRFSTGSPVTGDIARTRPATAENLGSVFAWLEWRKELRRNEPAEHGEADARGADTGPRRAGAALDKMPTTPRGRARQPSLSFGEPRRSPEGRRRERAGIEILNDPAHL